MQDWLMAQMRDGFPAFRGASLAGTIPVKEELINELLAEWLAQAPAGASAQPPFDLNQFVSFIKTLSIHADAGVVTVHVDARI